MHLATLPVWIAYSFFNYNIPNESVLNVAYPSAISYYFITVQSQNNNYEYSGKFLNGEYVYQSSLTVYDTNGYIDNNYKIKNNNNTLKEFVLNVKNEEIKYIVIRYYCNLNKYNLQDYINNLPVIRDIKLKCVLPCADQNIRNNVSEKILYPFYDKNLNKTIQSTFSEFFYSTDSFGLFPDITHFYLFARPGDGKLFKISGKFIQNKTYPYADFITIVGNGTKTENGIPFYDFRLDHNNNYIIYVATPDISESYIEYIVQSTNNIILRWNSIENIGLIFRMITYSQDGIVNFNKTMTPFETKEKMISGFYPIFEKIL
tara:strand:- start:51 stop:1001 length:951 start_codon:yes stop_codon:yes gene_type:complete